MSTLMAFDTSYLYFRAYFGVPASFASPEGFPVNAVRGTCDFITRLIGQYSPDEIVCAWDDDWRPAWRVELVPSYKTHRLDEAGEEAVEADLARQVPWIRQVLEAVGLPVVGVAGHEADDVLASLAAQHEGPSLIVTGDRDLFQLVDESTSVVYVGKSVSKNELITPEVLAQKYSLAPGRYLDYSVLRGDPSDGLPGVKGVGEKTAAALVRDYPTLDAMLAAARDEGSTMAPAMRRKLLADPDYLPRALPVVTAVPTLELPSSDRGPIDMARVEDLTDELGLGSALERLANALR